MLGACTAALADDGSVVEGIGGTVKLMKPEHSSVRMVRERVDATIDRDKADVRCEFVFKNEGPALTVTTGFPDQAYSNSEDYSGQDFRSAMRYFKSWVDGVPAGVRHNRIKRGQGGEGTYYSWWLKDVPFAAGQTRRVVDRYGTSLGVWTQGSRYCFDYVLITGASWKGRIGLADIRVHVKRPPQWGDANGVWHDMRFTSAWPPGYRRSGDTITWNLKDLEPKQDIQVWFVESPVVTGLGLFYGFGDYYVRNGVTIVNLSRCSETSQLKLTEYPKQGSCKVSYGGRSVKFFDGSRWAVVDGHKRVRMPVAANLTRMEAPLATIVRALGGRVDYYADTWNVGVTLPKLKKDSQAQKDTTKH